MSKGSKPRPYSDKKEYYSNWDGINWSNKKEDNHEEKALPVEKVLKTSFDDVMLYQEDTN